MFLDDNFFELTIVSLIGLLLGSFATVLYWRIPRKRSWFLSTSDRMFSRSKCLHCGHQLAAYDLFPVISWVIRGGKCGYCKEEIGFSHLLIEILTLAACLGIYSVHGLTIISAILILMVPFLVALIFIDIDHMILPNQLILILLALTIGYTFLPYILGQVTWDNSADLYNNLLGMVLFPLIIIVCSRFMSFFLKKETLGLGDVKFFSVCGLLLGFTHLPIFLIFSGAIGVAIGLFYNKILCQQIYPFGPALIIAFYAGMLFT